MKLKLFGFLLPQPIIESYYSVALSVGSSDSENYLYNNIINIPISSVLILIEKDL